MTTKKKWATGYKQLQVQVTVTESELEHINRIAKELNLNRSEAFRYLLGMAPLPKGRRLKPKVDVNN